MPCREHLARVGEQQETFDRLGAVVAAVTFEPPERAAAFALREKLPFPVLSDPARRAYAAFGLGRGRPAQVWNWNAVWAYVRGGLHGRLPQLPQGDLDQLGGDFVLDRSGRIIYAYRSTGSADRPPVADIVAAVRRAVAEEPEERERV